MDNHENGRDPREPGPHLRKINWDALTAIIAVIIALIATLVSAYTAWEQHEQTRAQVWPHLVVGTAGVLPGDESGSFMSHGGGLIAISAGVGPAIISRVEFQVNGKAQPDWPHAFLALGYTTGESVGAQSMLSGSVLPPGKTQYWLIVNGETKWRTFKQKIDSEVTISVCYSSALGDHWIASWDHGEPGHNEPVRSCSVIPKRLVFHS